MLVSEIVVTPAIAVTAVLALVLAVVLLWQAHRRHPYNTPFVLVYGDEPTAHDFLRKARQANDARFCRFVGCIATNGSHAGMVEGVPIVGRPDALRGFLFHNPVDTVIYASDPSSAGAILERFKPALEVGARVGLLDACVTDPLPCIPLPVRRQRFLGQPVTFVRPLADRTLYWVAKRVIDIVLSALGLLFLAPVFFFISIAIKLTSPGPLFYPWYVLGKNGKPFVGYKFRTMVPNADALKKDLMHLNEMSGPVFKIKNDPRVTPLGRVLRKFSLDELPQLYSVLKGDMSLVGPRPPSKAEAEKFQFWQRGKLNVKPGITCLWQVSGRNQITSFDDWARLDIEYIRTASLWTDAKILLRTIPVVVLGKGAY